LVFPHVSSPSSAVIVPHSALALCASSARSTCGIVTVSRALAVHRRLVRRPCRRHGHQYALTETIGDWNQTQAEANSQGGYLVSITSAEKDAWILNTFGPMLIAEDEGYAFWAGGYQPFGVSPPGVGWQWTSGEPWGYTNWTGGEPNDGWGGDAGEQYLMIGTASRAWNDSGLTNNGDHRGVIESSVPEPSALVLLGIGAVSLLAYAWRRRRTAMA
jgi:hypothetical protein